MAQDSEGGESLSEGNAFGSRADAESHKLSKAIHLYWLADGDRGFKPRRASGRSEAENWQDAVAAAAFIKGL